MAQHLKPTLTIFNSQSRALQSSTLKGFRYFWLKTVIGFNPDAHCARCLLGEYNPEVWKDMSYGIPSTLNMSEGAIGYLCGVASPYRWERNLHVAFRVETGATLSVRTYAGDLVNIANAARIPFDDTAARTRFPDKGQAFLTCRNFQFGAQHFRG